ncbi:adenylate kinase [Helicobacter sp. 13S00477-4]|uniref:adenylate kinase n=1 Tax=Helicobacter sp. 13S00477-4 TaxID=1905759 RepID=UPI000BA5323D|nr:adenylate kinase [Helicobacter sp. 13S00477-4]PAF52719.1 adenylate kinase [Helicobacter sp. 13S00477-4]
MKKLFLLIGAPGSGKTTDAQIIAQNHSDRIVHYSTGDLLRSEITSGSERGKLIDSFTSKGNLVPLEIVVETIVTAINNTPKQIILIDGYPRSIQQMEALDKVLKSQSDIELLNVIEVVVSEDIARDRVLGRARGADDDTEIFDNRMKVYLEPLESIETFYSHKGILKKINGERSIEEIVNEIESFIQSKI